MYMTANKKLISRISNFQFPISNLDFKTGIKERQLLIERRYIEEMPVQVGNNIGVYGKFMNSVIDKAVALDTNIH